MKREHLAFLSGGFAFGLLFGFAVAYAFSHRPELRAEAAQAVLEGPRGPQSPTQMGGGGPSGGAAPMMARVNDLKQALTGDPRNVRVLVELADIYQQAAMFEQAAGYYERALAVEAEHYELLINLGLCYRGMGAFDRALAAFARAHELAPGQWQALFNTVVVAATDVHDFDVALAALEQIEALDPRPAGLDAAQLRQLRDWLEQVRTNHPGEGQS